RALEVGDHLRDGVVGLAHGLQLDALGENGPYREAKVASGMIEVKVAVGHDLHLVDRDAGRAQGFVQRPAHGQVRHLCPGMPLAAGGFEEKHEFPRDLFQHLGAMGLCGIPYDEAYGGGGQSYLTYLAVLEEIATGFFSLALTLSVHHLSAFGVHGFGSSKLKEK